MSATNQQFQKPHFSRRCELGLHFAHGAGSGRSCAYIAAFVAVFVQPERAFQDAKTYRFSRLAPGRYVMINNMFQAEINGVVTKEESSFISTVSEDRVTEAKQASVPNQFPLGTLILCGGSGLPGVWFAVIVVQLVSRLCNWPALIAPNVVAHMVFGPYLASKAARMDPVGALRYE